MCVYHGLPWSFIFAAYITTFILMVAFTPPLNTLPSCREVAAASEDALATKCNILWSRAGFTPPQSAEHPIISPPEDPIISLQDYAAITADKFSINGEQFTRLIACESEWKEDALGDHGVSFGILQFKKNTFEMFTKKYGLINLDINNSYHQVDLAAQMISDGYGFHWKNCVRKIAWKI